ncbi:two pore domain potassium channel family protein [Streptomyces sp. So13.3]|uniref:potassium channel family protein n=1 Tax=Streptomyces TaxID=1883 RepID=UPI001106F730|nr:MULTISPECIES: potassium channel family protein [Streptomyces]QNA75723.1 two pore domain potassium channel family protein [Streptomyces sp. So13.3]
MSGIPITRQRRRVLVGCLLRSAASAVLLTWLYYLAPLDRALNATTATLLALGLIAFGCLIAWQVVAVTHAAYPGLRAIEALATAVPLFLLLFSSTYFLVARDRPASFSEPLNRTDALYFTVTVFATVGFGDISPVTELSRVLTTVQMIADLILVGLIAKVLFGAVRIGLRRRGTASPTPSELPEDGP